MDAMFKQKMENQAEWYGKNARWMNGWMNGTKWEQWKGLNNVYNRQIIIQLQKQQRQQRSC